VSGKLIVIDGVDGSGKATQADLLVKRLQEDGHRVVKIEFPRYTEESSALIRDYLNGKFGTAEEVGPYRGSIFYAIDRYSASFELKKLLEDGYIVIADRYVSANKGHQASKIESRQERAKFLLWINELEYDIFGIPVPDLTIFLHLPAELSYELVLKKTEREYIKRKNKKQDIHEADKAHLEAAERAYTEMSLGFDPYENWVKLECAEGETVLPINKIAESLYTLVKSHLAGV